MSEITPDTVPGAIRTVVLVGHCGFDSGSIRRAVAEAAPDVEIVSANRSQDLEPHTHAAALWLVNRQLDGAFATGSGVELIRRSVVGNDAPSAMLISNYEDAQQEAEAAGALPGFGKNAVGRPAATEAIRRALAGHAELGRS